MKAHAVLVGVLEKSRQRGEMASSDRVRVVVDEMMKEAFFCVLSTSAKDSNTSSDLPRAMLRRPRESSK